MYCVRWSNEAATIHADITADHRDVPVFLQYGKRLSQEPPDMYFQAHDGEFILGWDSSMSY